MESSTREWILFFLGCLYFFFDRSDWVFSRYGVDPLLQNGGMMFKPEKFSDYLSIIALLFSSLSLFVSWRNFIRDRSHLKLSLDFENLQKRGSQFKVTITNDGRRPTTLIKLDALFWFRKRKNLFRQETTLTEGAHKLISAPLAGFPSISNPLAIRAFEAVDSVGHKYRAGTLRLFYKIITAKN